MQEHTNVLLLCNHAAKRMSLKQLQSPIKSIVQTQASNDGVLLYIQDGNLSVANLSIKNLLTLLIILDEPKLSVFVGK